MCVDHKISCNCGKNSISFNFKDDLLPTQVVSKLYCPACPAPIGFNPAAMVSDNGWIIEYDMDIARFLMQNVLHEDAITPEFLFDESYCSWRGLYPNDHLDSAREREELARLAKSDPKRYFTELKIWGTRRMERLAREGWRKAHETERITT